MATPISMPRQGQSVETCIITRWHYKKGDRIDEGDDLLSYETDKASFNLESPVSGTLLGVFFREGDEVAVGENIAVVGSEGESVKEFRPEKGKNSRGKQAGGVTVRESRPATADTDAANTGKHPDQSREPEITKPKRRISPRARRMAADLNISIENLKGTGPYGRITAVDVQKATATEPSTTTNSAEELNQQYTITKLTNLRRLVAERMHRSLQQSAQLTHHISADARKILAYRASFKSLPEDASNRDITLNDMVSHAVVRVLLSKPYLNAHFLGDSIKVFRHVHLGFAVDTERGLMVPVVKDADRCTLTELSAKMKELAGKCRKGKIDPGLLNSEEASFTISNLGGYGIEMFTPVLNLPQTGILGVNTISRRPADLGDGIVGIVPFIGLSLTYDHRAVDGAPASAFLKELKEYIESFEPAIG